MNISVNIFQTLIALGAVNGLIWCILLLMNKKTANVYLGLLVFVFALGGIKIILQEKIPHFNYSFPIPLLYQFAIGPLFYLYLKAALVKNYKHSVRSLLHFLPFILFDVLMFFILKRIGNIAQLEKCTFILDIAAFAFFSAYWILSIKTINRSNKDTGIDKGVIKWANQILFASGLIVFSWLIYIVWVIGFKAQIVFGILPYYPIYLIFSFCIYSIAILGYYKPQFGLMNIPSTEKKQLIPPAELELKKMQILNGIKEKELHHYDHISLRNLSQELNIPVNELSYIINSGFKVNFKDFINALRIQDLKDKLSIPDNAKFTILGLAYEVGFNSKASFYRAFKKQEGRTPAAFYKELQKN